MKKSVLWKYRQECLEYIPGILETKILSGINCCFFLITKLQWNLNNYNSDCEFYCNILEIRSVFFY